MTRRMRMPTFTRRARAPNLVRSALALLALPALGLALALAGAGEARAQARAADVAGRYAVLREDGRDTGCMVTLHPTPRGKGFRAQLAPACRDQGVVVFDPVGWWLEKGKLHLQARKGHNIALDAEAGGAWLKKDGRPLGLKRI